MCLAIPGKVLSTSDGMADVEFGKLKMKVNIAMVPEIKPGEYCLVHAGFAIEQIDEEYAVETNKYLEELHAVENKIK
jgi:hydrogenase expression/formation protein HypC